MRLRLCHVLLVFSFLLPQFLLAQERHFTSARDMSSSEPALLRHARPIAEEEYERLCAVGSVEAREQIRELPAEMKADVWTLQLERFLMEHPRLTRDQRAVVSDAMELIATGLFEVSERIDHSTTLWDTTVRQPLDRLQERANAVFPSDIASEVFTRIGTGPAKPRSKSKLISQDFPPCDCSTSDPTSCGINNGNCVANGPGHRCFFTDGCGTLGASGCNGLCTL